MKHENASEYAGKTVVLETTAKHLQVELNGAEYRVEDWWDRVHDKSWMFCTGNPACIVYGLRSGLGRLPLDDEVLYGKIGAFGHLIHISEVKSVYKEKADGIEPAARLL